MRSCFVSLFLVIGIFAISCAAKDKHSPPQPQHPIEPGAKLFVTPMDRNLDSFIIAEVQKQKAPFVVVLNKEEAQYVLTGFSQTTGGSWADDVAATIFGGKDKYEASVKMVTADGQSLIWSGEAGDRSLLLGAFRRGGQRKVAERIVKEMREDLFPTPKKK